MENIFSDTLLPVTLAIITLGMGLSLEFVDIKRIFLYPKAIITGLCCQMLLLPAIAFTIALFSKIDPAFKVGLIILSACPGGATSNLITYILSGNVALSISMTAINSLITLITIPFIVSAGLAVFMSQNAEINLPVLNTILKVFLVTVLPASAGMMIRRYYTKLADSLDKPQKYVLPLLLLAIYAGVIFIDKGEESSKLMDHLYLYPNAFLLNSVSMLAGWIIAKSLHLGRRNQYTISVEVGLQNSALAIFVAVSLLDSHSMALVPVIYGSFSFFTTALFGYGVKKISR